LVDGTLVEKAVGSWESIIASRIITALSNFMRGKNLGWVTGEQGPARTSKSRVRMPDASVFLAEQFPDRKIPSSPIPAISPALVTEVLSRGNTKLEMKQKTKEFFSAGTRLLWLVDPKQQTVSVFDHDSVEPAEVVSQGQTLTGGAVLPGFTIEVSEIFSLSY
jgi:Uma2 family endonuclease